MKVIVTGGAGFIGSHVVEELLNHQYEVVLIDSLGTGSLENLPNDTKLYQFDINDAELGMVFEQERPDYVIHLAAQASVTASLNDPMFDIRSNTVGTIHLLHLSQKYQIKKFIFASSAAVYGDSDKFPISEQQAILPLSYYALSKYSSEKYIQLTNALYGLNSCILRFSNVYGPRQNSIGEAGVISLFIRKILKGEEITIYGGQQTRDFAFVKDVAKACRLALERERTGIYNISSGKETAIDELLTYICHAIGKTIKPIYAPFREGEIEKSVLDNRKALDELEWCIDYSLLEGLEETVQYYKQINRLQTQ